MFLRKAICPPPCSSSEGLENAGFTVFIFYSKIIFAEFQVPVMSESTKCPKALTFTSLYVRN